jgi:signal transduction histidine kinase/CheY-like chemotaxis protein
MSIRLRYIIALCVVAAVVSLSAISMSYIFKTQKNDASVINMAGQQRMLSQRIALFVQRLSTCNEREQFNANLLLASINKFEVNHTFLSTLPNLSKKIDALYFSSAAVDQEVNDYISTARNYASNPQCSKIPELFQTIRSDALLVKLDLIVQEFEFDANRRVAEIENLELLFWITTLIILMLEAIYIFRPMEMKITETISSLDKAIKLAQKAEVKAINASKAKSEFLASMSHELRTPMNGLFGMIELAIDNPKKSDDYLKKAKNAGRQLLLLINDVLDLSKIEAGKLKIENISFDLYQVIDDAVSLQAIHCRKKGLEFHYGRDTDLPDAIISDPTRISQVLHNLLSNAIKFTEQGQISLNVNLTIKEQKYWLTFVIQDTGLGISQENIQTIFNKFEQADQTTTRLYGGTGLGLSISAQITQLLGGTLTVDSKLGQGSTFRFSIPIKRDKRTLPIQSNMMLNCAIVDDLQTSREYLQHLVELQGLNSTSFISGVDFLNNHPEKYDLVLLDLSMPNIDGIGTIEAILSKNLSSLPYIILVSAVLEHLECSDKVRSAIWRTHAKPIDRLALERDLIEVQSIIQKRTIVQDKELNKNKHILVVEDNEINAEVVKAMLENEKYDVTIAYNGRIGIDACLVQNFDLILMDVQMPVLDGLSATKILREEHKLKTPIVALTANAFSEDREQCLDAGMNDFLSKPIDKIKLISKIEWLIFKSEKG